MLLRWNGWIHPQISLSSNLSIPQDQLIRPKVNAGHDPTPEQSQGATAMMTKTGLIELIHDINPSADLGWLDEFSPEDLHRYLSHLQHTLEPRGSVWERQGDTTAVVSRRPAA